MHPWGVLGGDTGMRSTKRLVRANGKGKNKEEWLPSKCDGIKVEAGDVLYFNTWGGGGWGDPLKRKPELVLEDINRGLVSVAGAKRYGVVVTDGKVSAAKTKTVRAKMRKARGRKLPMFNFGGTVEEIKKKALKETHLAAPVTPTFLGKRR